MERRLRSASRGLIALLVAVCGLWPTPAAATDAILLLGDSITQGGDGYASYRYPLWFLLEQGNYDVDFVGEQDETFTGPPDSVLYPDYYTTFDRQHEGHWGWRTDQVRRVVKTAMTNHDPSIALIHLGTNDIGQMGPMGLANADSNLRQIVAIMRGVNPRVTILLAQVVPIGPGTTYYAWASLIPDLNAAIATIANDMSTADSPIILVDQNSGFDLETMMQSNGLHPNEVGEVQMAQTWYAELAPRLDLSPVGPPGPIQVVAVRATPNPFNPRTEISFSLLQTGRVELGIYDPTGRRITTLAERVFSAGSHDLIWQGRDATGHELPSGIYLVHLRTGQTAVTEKVTLLR